MSVSQKHTVSHSINVARSSPKIAVVVVQEIVLMWFRSVGRVVWVGNADGRGGGVGGGGGDGLGEDGVPEKRVRRDIGAWKGAVVVIVVVGVVVLVMVADGDPLTTLIMVTQVKVVGKEEIQIDRSSS